MAGYDAEYRARVEMMRAARQGRPVNPTPPEIEPEPEPEVEVEVETSISPLLVSMFPKDSGGADPL